METVKVGKTKYDKHKKTKETIKLWCLWCQHIDKYWIAKFDQPRCKKCSRFIPKRRYLS